MTTYLLDDMQIYIATNVGGLTFGTNLFVGAFPDMPDTVTTLFEYEGQHPEYTMGPSTLPAIAKPNLQVVTRDPTYTGSRDQCETVARALEAICNTTVNGTYYLRVGRLQDPFFMQRDAVKRRVFFACNFEVDRVPS